jgi:hypothetical protein
VKDRDLRNLLDTHEVIRRVYNDDRFPPPRGGVRDLRQFTITTLWVAGIERPPSGAWQSIAELMHLDCWEVWRISAEDARRYAPDDDYDRRCPAPMVRRGGPCGRRGTYAFRVTDPTDGTWRIEGFCSRHGGYAQEVRAAELARSRAGGIPEPLPNRGGLLPCYVNADWPDLYAQACPGWAPPRVGIRADDWPVMAKIAEFEPPTLKVLAGGVAAGEMPPLPAGESSAPTLKLIRS